MSLQSPRRGRPKGSGIDDLKLLESIAAMIAAKPDLKPTTAIKALGVTDPSAIRRLRDKFHAFATEMSAAATSPSAPSTAPARVVAAAVTGDSEAVRELPRITTVSIDHTVQTVVDPAAGCASAAATPLPNPLDVFAFWCGVGLSALSSAMATQAAVTRNLTRLPHVDFALRQHLAFNEMALAMVAGRPAARTTLH